MQFKLAVLLTLIAASVNGAVIRSIPAAACTCGGNKYSAADTQNAIAKGRTGVIVGKNKYPHTYNSWDVHIDFSPKCTAPFLVEFPLVKGGVFTKDPPGPDRVVYDLSGDFCGCMTHTGATGSGFVHCQ